MVIYFMPGKYVPMLNRFYTSLYLVGAVCLLLFLGAVSVGWFDRQMYLLVFRVVLLTIALLLLAIFLFPSLLRMIQLRDMDSPHSSLSTGGDQKPDTPPAQASEPLSKEDARQWLDTFLVEQQKQEVSNNPTPPSQLRHGFAGRGAMRDTEIKK